MKRFVVALLVACGSPPPPQPIGNIAPVDPTRENACEPRRLTGTVIVSDDNNAPGISATVVATVGTNAADISASDTDAVVVVVDEYGKFVLDKLDAHDTLIVYYDTRMYQAPLPKRCEPVTLEIDIRPKIDSGTVRPLRIK